MKPRRHLTATAVLALFLVPVSAKAQDPFGGAFTYQGQVKEGGSPATGSYDMQFGLYDAPDAENPLDLYPDGGPITVEVQDGLFTVVFEFDSAFFDGEQRWLEVVVERVPLAPRQELTATPYSLYALSSGDAFSLPFDGHVETSGSAFAVTNDGTGRAAYFRTAASDNANNTVWVQQNGLGGVAYLLTYNEDSPNTTLRADNNGLGRTAHLSSLNSAGDQAALLVDNYGLGRSGRFKALNPSNAAASLEGSTVGTGPGVWGYTTGSGPAVKGQTNGTGNAGYFWVNNTDNDEAAVLAETEGEEGRAIVGHALNTANALNYGGYFSAEGGSGVGVYGQAVAGTDGTGVKGSGSFQGGYFEDADASGYARVGYDAYGIWAEGGIMGGYFADSAGASYAHVGDGDCGIRACGANAGGHFSTDTGHAYVGTGPNGILARGPVSGGHFEDYDDSGHARVGYGDYGISAYGASAGGYFECSDASGHAYVGMGQEGIVGWGTMSGGYFADSDSSGYAYVGHGSYKILGNGAVSFVQNHPEDADKVIVYACPEGDEVATYTRGTARLVDGSAVVPLGETFKWVTNPDIGLTAHLTPRDHAVPLAVVALTTAELVVRGPEDGPDDVVFDYIVYGLRIGFEEVSIVQEKEHEAYIPSMAGHHELYERRPELSQYNALERFDQMRAVLGEADPLDLSASRALRDAIIEFDPAVHKLPRREEPPPDEAASEAEPSDAELPDAGPVVGPETSDEPGSSTRVGFAVRTMPGRHAQRTLHTAQPTRSVLLSARDALHEIARQKDCEIEALRARLDALETLVAELGNREEGGAQ
jgi:hypothetical protein